MTSADEQSEGPVIRDRRRIDPVTGKVRDREQAGQAQARPGGPGGSGPGGSAAAGPAADSGPAAGAGEATAAGGASAPVPAGQPAGTGEEMQIKLAERTADLQRLQAEYANYRKRVERDRTAVREQALANVLSQLLPVLDDIGRAREHGELVGGFKQVAESLEAAVSKLGLTPYADAGDPFDPTLHEALMHSYSDDVTEPTCVSILQPGYKVGERILRPARVAVAEPGESGESGSGSGGQPDAAGQAGAGDGGAGPDTPPDSQP
ncbi:MAG: nucleotide exchange factor GrpE [Streptosporangiaceae bacterium]